MFTLFATRLDLISGKLNSMQFWLLVLCLAGCLTACTAKRQAIATTNIKQSVDTQPTLVSDPSDSLIINRRQLIENTLKQKNPIILLLNNVDDKQIFAQYIAVQNPAFTQHIRSADNEPLLNEVFGVYPARQSDLPQGTQNYGNLYRVEMYNFGLNMTTIALADVNTASIIGVNHFSQMQPDPPPQLIEIALSIATHAKQVEQALGFKPTPETALMSNTKTALNRSRCERSQHLCVSPTFIKDDKALWVVVDLTDLKLVGVRWTNVGSSQAMTERRYQNETMMECFCRKDSLLQQDKWKMYFMLTSSDGLKISSVYYEDKLVLQSAKLVDFHVSYSNSDGFGYSDAVGCPMFSQSAVVAITPPEVQPIEENGKTIGFALEQDYFSEGWPAPCNYNYVQRYEFYDDGRFRVSVGSLGRGCGNNGTYRPVTRIVFAPNFANFYEWNDSQWKLWNTERWQMQNVQTTYTDQDYQYKIDDGNQKGYYMVANNGQFNDGGRGDNAYTFITKHHPDKDEGDADLVTIGPCCNSDYHQGPEKFIEPNPESLNNEPFVLWYVPQIKNDDTPGKEYCWAQSYIEKGVIKVKTYPCISGPMFVPFKN